SWSRFSYVGLDVPWAHRETACCVTPRAFAMSSCVTLGETIAFRQLDPFVIVLLSTTWVVMMQEKTPSVVIHNQYNDDVPRKSDRKQVPKEEREAIAAALRQLLDQRDSAGRKILSQHALGVKLGVSQESARRAL